MFQILAVFEDGSEFDRIENLWLFIPAQAITFGVAATLDVEQVLVGPDMLVVSNKLPVRVTAESCLASATKSKQDRRVAIRSQVR